MNEIDIRALVRLDLEVSRMGHWQDLEASQYGQLVNFDELVKLLEYKGFKVLTKEN